MTLKTRGGLLLASGGHLCLTCCDACSDPWAWQFTQAGGAVWSEPAAMAVMITYLDSLECGGTCDVIQSGKAESCFVAPETSYLTVSATGLTETENSDYDWVRIKVNGLQKLYLASIQGIGGCEMEVRTGTVSIPTVAGNIYRLEVESSTRDNMYHVGAYWRVQFMLGAIPAMRSPVGMPMAPEVVSVASRRYAICKACTDSLQDGFGCRHYVGCCFGRRRSDPGFQCPRNLWPTP